MFEKILKAAERLHGIAHKTPVLQSTLLNREANSDIFLKCENFQKIGAFKFRGAYNAIAALDGEIRRQGIVAFSSGNHAQAVAVAGHIFNVPTTIVMPDDAPTVKIEATRSYGAKVITYNRLKESREQIAEQIVYAEGASLIPPYDHEEVIAGQGTAVKELIDEVGRLDYVITPCGGGGLLSGSAIAAKNLLTGCKVVGVEPEMAADATRSFYSGVLDKIEHSSTIADGLRTPSLGKITFPLVRQYVDEMVTVSEDEIKKTMYFIWTRMKIIVEPSGAVALAAVLFNKFDAGNKKIGVIISGGNVDFKMIGRLFADQ